MCVEVAESLVLFTNHKFTNYIPAEDSAAVSRKGFRRLFLSKITLLPMYLRSSAVGNAHKIHKMADVEMSKRKLALAPTSCYDWFQES